MKVFFDGNIFTSQKRGGISRVGFELMKSLGSNNDVEQIFYRGLHVDNYPFRKEWFKKYYGLRKPDAFNSRAFNLSDNMGMELAYRLNASTDVIFQSLFYRVPQNPKGPVVVICYDMIHELFGGNAKSIAFKKKAFDKADLIIAMSESTKRDLCKLYPIDKSKVIIAYPGVEGVFFSAKGGPTSGWKDNNTTDNKRPYMLYVGSRSYRYKNFDFLLDTFISKKYFLHFDLVLVGGEKDLAPNQKEKVKNTQGQGSWLLQEFCDDQRLAELYSSAAVLVYPSLYEGFGIPPIEAMAAGCPVVASHTPAVKEAVGDAGLLFDPENSEDLAGKIEKIITDKTLAAQLIQKGKIRAKQFTWKNMADVIYRGYQTLL